MKKIISAQMLQFIHNWKKKQIILEILETRQY